jgi:hypothetical protein
MTQTHDSDGDRVFDCAVDSCWNFAQAECDRLRFTPTLHRRVVAAMRAAPSGPDPVDAALGYLQEEIMHKDLFTLNVEISDSPTIF